MVSNTSRIKQSGAMNDLNVRNRTNAITLKETPIIIGKLSKRLATESTIILCIQYSLI